MCQGVHTYQHVYYVFVAVDCQNEEIDRLNRIFDFRGLKFGKYEPAKMYIDGHVEVSWKYDLNIKLGDVDIDEIIKKLFDELGDVLPKFRELIETNAHLKLHHYLVVYYQGSGGHIGFHLSDDVMKRLAEMKLILDIEARCEFDA